MHKQYFSASTKAPVLVAALFIALILPLISFPEITKADISNTRLDAWNYDEYSGSSWMTNNGGGVDVYSNGSTVDYRDCNGTIVSTYAAACKSSVNGVVAGAERQCVELFNRLYLTKGWITSTWTGSGNTVYNAAMPTGFSKEDSTHTTYINPGDAITFDDGGSGHVVMVNSVSGSTVNVVSQNTQGVLWTVSWNTTTHTLTQTYLGSTYSVQGIIHRPVNPSGTSSRFALTNGGGQLFASDHLNGLTQESSAGDALKIAVGGPYQVRETGGGQMFYATSPGSTWLPITNPGTVTNVAVGSSGSNVVFMYMDNCGAIYTNNTASMTGWHNVTGCGAKAMSAGGNNIAFVDSTNTAYAATTWNGTPNRVSNVGDATNIAVSNQGILMMISGCGAAYSNSAFLNSGWHAFTVCGDATAITTGGLYIGFINGGGTAWGATTWNGSIHQISNAGDAHAISMNNDPRVLMISSCNAAYAKDDVNDKNNWVGQTGCNDATAIAG